MKSMDETQNSWGPEAKKANAVELEVIEPSGAPAKAKKHLPKRISDHKLDEALAELNLLSISSEKLKSFSTIGRFLDQIGIVQYGNGRLVGTAEAMAGAMRACADVVAEAGNDNETKERFIMLQLRLAKALDANVALINEVNETGATRKPQPEQQNKPFAVGGIVSPIQINVHASPVATPEKPA